MDPETSVITNGQPESIRPDVLGEKLNNVNEKVSYILKYREKKALEENKN